MIICKNPGCLNVVPRINKYEAKVGLTDKTYQPKECFSCKSTRRRYGITAAERQEILDEQNGKCAICERSIEFTGKGRNGDNSAALDHCHETGKLRGVLCYPCNLLLGKVEDDVEHLLKAIKYLQEHNYE